MDLVPDPSAGGTVDFSCTACWLEPGPTRQPMDRNQGAGRIEFAKAKGARSAKATGENLQVGRDH